MEQKNQQSGGNGSGFLLGVIVGVLLALLFTTKRGREILKDVLERGVEKFGDLEKLMQEHAAKETAEKKESDFVPAQPPPPALVKEAKVEQKIVAAKPASPSAGSGSTTPAPKPAAAPAVATKEVKTPATQAISPHVVQSVPVVAKVEQKVEEIKEAVKEEIKEAVKEAIEEAPQKVSTGKRWFRGLRKRS